MDCVETYAFNSPDGSLEVVRVSAGWAIWSSRTRGCVTYYASRSDAGRALAKITGAR